MFDALKRYSSVVGGFAEIPRKRAEQIASALAKQGLVSTDQVRSLADEIARRGHDNRERVLEFVRREIPKLGVASKTELERLRRRVQALEATQRASAKKSAPARRAAKRAPAKKAKKRSSRR